MTGEDSVHNRIYISRVDSFSVSPSSMKFEGAHYYCTVTVKFVLMRSTCHVFVIKNKFLLVAPVLKHLYKNLRIHSFFVRQISPL